MSGEELDRAADLREAYEARHRRIAKQVAEEDRAQFWDRLGYNIRTDAGIEKLSRDLHITALLDISIYTDDGLRRSKGAVAWMFRSFDRSETLGKRLLSWISGIAAIATVLGGLIQYYVNWRTGK